MLLIKQIQTVSKSWSVGLLVISLKGFGAAEKIELQKN